MKRIVLTGGGTAGHVTPNLALIPALLNEGWDVHYIATKDGIEKKLLAQVPNVTYHEVHTGKLRRYLDIKNLSDPFRVLRGIAEAALIIRKLKPNIVFSKGGFVSVPVVYGAALNRVPVLAHESDMTAGLANKLAAPFCKKILCTFPEAAGTAGTKGCYVGTPMRASLFTGRRESGLKRFGFSGSRPVLMITGGSSGAAAINRTVRQALPRFTQFFDVLHLCGEGNLVTELDGTKGYCQVEYLNEEMPDAYAMADVIISRAGSNTVCEILALRKPSLLIPYPSDVSRGDQVLNAESFEKRGLARVLQQADMTPDTLFEHLKNTYRDRGQLIDAMEKEPNENGVKAVMEYIRQYALSE